MIPNSLTGVLDQHWCCTQNAHWEIEDSLVVTNHVRAVAEVKTLLNLTR